jgi:crossover junction endodeoxyribonuclease RusA
MNLTLPYPPSVNSMYRAWKGRMLISKRGREWMKLAVSDAKKQINGWYVTGNCEFVVMAYMPDNRRRDIDNLLKPLQDCMTHAGIWKDDCQVKHLRITHCGVDKANPRCECSVVAL